MKITLKKASALQRALLAIKVQIPNMAVISIYAKEPVEELYAAARQKRLAAKDQAVLLLQTAYEIRSLIAEANVGEVSAVLTKRALIDGLIKLLDEPIQPAPNLDIVAQRMERNRAEASQYNETEKVVIENDNADLRALRRQKLELDEKLTGLNHNLTVTLPQHVVQVLQDNDLV